MICDCFLAGEIICPCPVQRKGCPSTMQLRKCFQVSLLLGLHVLSVELLLECYTCDSTEDSECATRPGQQISVEECSSDTDQCVTVIVSGITRRGCLSRLYPNLYCPEPCDRCDWNLCNRHIYPADRLHCYQCSGSSCLDVSEQPSLLLPCPVYNANDRCYTNVIGTSNALRGCEYTNLPTTCPNVCLKCNYDGCNNELAVHEQHCRSCSHSTTSPNSSCLRSLNATAAGKQCAIDVVDECTNKLLYGHVGKCFTYVNDNTGIVQRGCSTTMGFYPTGTLTQCYGEYCNAECLDISCNNCTASASDDASCRTGLNLRSQTCASGTTACFSCEAGSNLRRGCADASFTPDVENEVCYECRDSDGCNRTPVRSCYHCSSLEDEGCAEWSDAAAIERRNCSAATELCVSTLTAKLDVIYTVRGCASDIPECTPSDPYCVRCNGSLCNTVPIAWRSPDLLAQNVAKEIAVRSTAHREQISAKLFNAVIVLFLIAAMRNVAKL